jgi:hypothetical protein
MIIQLTTENWSGWSYGEEVGQKPVFIESDQITYFAWYEDRTRIYFDADHYLLVFETPSEVLEIISPTPP